MWKKLPCSKPLFLSFTANNGYFIYITNYINIWWVHYNENEFLNLLKKSNDDLEMENDNQLLQLGLKMLLHPESLKKVHCTFEDKSLIISMTLSCGFLLYLDMKLTEGSREMFFKNVTQQLLKTIHDLKASENELRHLLIKKDKEIEEYKNETDVRLAMYLKTGVFCDEVHTGRHQIYESNFGKSEISDCLLRNVIDETDNGVIIKQENLRVDEHRVKVEPDSQLPIKNEQNLVDVNERSSGLNIEAFKREIKSEPINRSPTKKIRKLLKL